MPYYPTLAEDLARAKEILAKGRAAHVVGNLITHAEGMIAGGDTYAAYQLLASFVVEIERLQQQLQDIDKALETLPRDEFDGVEYLNAFDAQVVIGPLLGRYAK